MTGMLTGCDDQVMEWKNKDNSVTIDDIPLQLAEQIANYDYIKAYAAKYHPNLNIACGVGADNYVGNAAYKQVVDDNFTGITLGNAMKHQSLVSATGKIDFTTVDAVLAAMPSGMKLYGHNFIWHTQQQQNYLKSLIAPEMVVVQDPGNDIANVLGEDASTFEGGSKSWGSWGNSSESGITSPGYESDYCMYLLNPTDANFWSAQCAYTFDDYLNPETTYKIRFYAKSQEAGGQVQFQYQNGSTYGSQGAYTTFDLTTSWTMCEVEFQPAYDDVNRILINFGAVGGTYYIDNIEFGPKQEASDITNVLGEDATTFEGGSKSWGSWGNSSESGVTSPGRDSDYCMYLLNPTDANAWSAQCAYTFDDYLDMETTYKIRFYAKSSEVGGQVQFQYQNGSTYGSQGGYTTFDLTTDWMMCEVEFQPAYDDVNRIMINFGAVAATYYIDDIEFGPKAGDSSASSAKRRSSISYNLKTADEKREILLGAMEEWIKAVAEHVGDRVDAWDVVNEPINDGGGWRGIDGKFGGSWTDDDVTYYDSEPEESTETGLTLNWGNAAGNGHFYWGYFIGKDYAAKAFEFARKYAPNAKLFVNDYNLETNPTKLATLIEFVNYIDQNGGQVDGIGTQMHVSSSISKDEVDAMFKTMAATGKLVRITELDVQVGTSSPTAAQLQTQAECYEMILNSYFENVPEAQQSAITIWGLSDDPDEHTYWLSGDCPNIFDANYGRKHAYKGVCDGLAGYDVSTDFSGSDWTKAQ